MRNATLSCLVCLLIIPSFIPLALAGPDTVNPPDAANISANALDVYISGPDYDEDYVRQEISFVNYVRDRKQAEVHVLVSRQSTGAGGREYTLEFIGRDELAALDDKVVYVCLQSDTEDEMRAKMVRKLKLGLVRYLLNTPQAEDIKILFSQPAGPDVIADRWNNWWFSISGHSYLNGEKSYRSINAWGSISAQRVTEATKFHSSIWGNYNEDKWDYEDYKALSISRSQGANVSMYFSHGDHWASGASTGIQASKYNNRDARIFLAPGFEYNIFPYSESSRRMLTARYQVGGQYVDYEEETIYGKMSEMLAYQQLRLTLDLIQPWGSIETSVSGWQYLHDFSKYNLRVSSEVSWRVFQGFSFDLRGTYSEIHDQLGLRKGVATEEEVLLRQHEMETSYTFWSSMGISYSFGSRNNNIVNPRFGG